MRTNIENYDDYKSDINLTNIKKIRKQKNMSVIKLALEAQISKSTLESYEQGIRIPSLPVIYRIAKALDTSIDNLVCNDELAHYYLLDNQSKEKVIQFINELGNNKQ